MTGCFKGADLRSGDARSVGLLLLGAVAGEYCFSNAGYRRVPHFRKESAERGFH